MNLRHVFHDGLSLGLRARLQIWLAFLLQRIDFGALLCNYVLLEVSSMFLEFIKLGLYLLDHLLALALSLLDALHDRSILRAAIVLEAVELVQYLAGHLRYLRGLAQFQLLVGASVVLFGESGQLTDGYVQAVLVGADAVGEALDLLGELELGVGAEAQDVLH